ncbi:MAG TPA: hypothetical protein PLN48_10355, partial [Lachnospiraceae bacterium]|nr:hypothetical protein [Lachnospiraceae bacterium]
MKTKLISIFLAICMVLTLCPVSGYAASVEVSQGTALSGTEPSAQGATEAASVESTAGNTDENASESTAESTTESSEEALADGAVPDEAVSAVQAQIDALPTAEELSAIDEEAFNAAGEQIHTAHDAYTALTEAQQAEITGAECFDTLFAVLNQGVSGRLFAVLTQAAVTPAQPSGSGTAADPYQIGTEAELWWFAGVVNGTLTDGTAQNTAACARLTADIAMSADTDWIPIAPGNDITTGSVSYTGTFDGNYHSITRLSAQVVVSGDKYPDADYGMFGYVGASGAIKKLMLSANSVRGYNDVGVLCGSNYGTIENCVVSISGTAGSTGVGSDVGGVCGNSYGTVKNCIFTGSSYGISGGFYGGIVENCYYLGTSETDSRDGTTFKTAAQFASGEVAYLLNGSTSTGTLVWYQTIGTDSYPSFSGGTVYCGYYAYDSNGFKTLGYSNGNTEVGEYEAVTKDSNGVYQIANAGQLYSFVEIVNSGANSAVEINAVLTADIDINPSYTFAADGTYSGGTSPRAWTPIGNASYSNTGTFDGQNHTVSGVYINGSNNYVGLFGYNSGTVQNIKLTNSYISGKEYVGGVCGYNNGTLSGSDNTGAVSGTSYYVGGVCGYNNGTLSNSYNTGTVTGTLNSVGGVCGSNGSTMTGSHNTGTVTGTGDSVGGVCGSNETNSKISTCYNTGTVTGKNSVGGVCGSNGSTMTGSHNTGTVTGTGDSVGGVCGLTSGTLSDNYNTGIVSGKSNYVGGVCGQIFRTGTITNCYYLTGFATDGSNAKQNGVGGNIEGSSTADVAGSTTAKTAEQFASGEVCWLLNGSTATGVWKQNIDNGVTSYDASPNFTGAAVYYVNYAGSYDENGFGSPANYSNTASTNSIYEPATLNNNGTTDDATDDYYEIANAGQLYWFAEKVNQTDGSGRGLNG